MKKIFSSNGTYFWILQFLFGMFGVYIGFITIKKFPVVVSGLSGLATIYLVNLLFFPPKDFFKTVPSKALSRKTAKYAFMCFLICLVLSWSLQYFSNSVFYALKEVTQSLQR